MDGADSMDPPISLTHALSEGERASFDAWWGGLTDASRAEIMDLCDLSRERSFFADPRDLTDPVPEVHGGRFLAHDDAWGLGEWGPDYFEYMLDHPEDFPIFDPSGRTFHIGCTAHPEARACLASGSIGPGFRCPRQSDACPLRRLLERASGRSIRLRVAASGKFAVVVDAGPRPDRD